MDKIRRIEMYRPLIYIRKKNKQKISLKISLIFTCDNGLKIDFISYSIPFAHTYSRLKRYNKRYVIVGSTEINLSPYIGINRTGINFIYRYKQDWDKLHI